MIGSIERRGPHRRSAGFTLLELVVGLVVLGVLGALAVPAYRDYVERARIAAAVAEIAGISSRIERFRAQNGRLPLTLAEAGAVDVTDPWDRPYAFLNFEAAGVPGRARQRKDRALVPINTDYDLYSVGRDGLTRPPLTARPSRDDVVRARDGGFIGKAEEF